MGGRGRGRGRGGGNGKFLQQLGVEKNELLQDRGVSSGEIFPHIDFDPGSTTGERTDVQSYALFVRKEIRENFQRSPYYIHPDMQHASDLFSERLRYIHALENSQNKLKLHCRHNLPSELIVQEKTKKKKAKGVVPNLSKAKKSKTVDVTKKLSELEELEKTEKGVDIQEEIDEDKNSEEEIEDEEEADEELDEGTDYAMNYDNDNDAYEEGEDNLEDEGCF